MLQGFEVSQGLSFGLFNIENSLHDQSMALLFLSSTHDSNDDDFLQSLPTPESSTSSYGLDNDVSSITWHIPWN